ncbi:MAG: hypothetical protein IJV15_08525 [Lachnospiraceae bacterium]|nr:hypothetical protein [Lachnospiraceae bacterium]MBR1597769.1 hypothetical protein [Lachnospiraceae bacterium]
MPRNQFQRMIFALLTVIITVHGYVFYSLYVVNGKLLMELNAANSVIDAINAQGGVYMFGRMLPIWAVVIVEFIFAYALECLVGSPLSFKMACRMFDPRNNHPMIFETAIISCTVLIMCPAMSFIAAFLYYPYYNGFNILTLIANWFELICHNFPFAFFSQVFFIQPIVRFIFGKLFAKDIAARNEQKEPERPQDETEAIADIFRRMNEIQERLEHERRQRKKLAEQINK